MGEENQSYANERKTKQCHYSSEREKKIVIMVRILDPGIN